MTPFLQLPRPSAPHRRRTTTVWLAILLALGAAVTSGAIPAQAADFPSGQWGSWNGERTRWGNILVAGRFGYCVDPGAPTPAVLDDARASRVCGGVGADGAPDSAAQLAYLLARYDQTTDDAVAVAVSQFARSQYHGGIPISQPAIYDQLVAEATRDGGPRAGLVVVDADNLTVWFGLVRAGETDRTTAHFADGFTAVLTITSPNATFASGDTRWTITTTNQVQSIPLVARHPLIAGEAISVDLTIADVPQSCYLLYTQGPVQRIATGLTMTLTAQGGDRASQTIWQPQISTVVAQPSVRPGATSLTDQVSVTAAGASQWPVARWADANQTQPQSYVPLVASADIARSNRPLPPSANLPAAASIWPGDPALLRLDGPGTTTAKVVLPSGLGSGYYALHWCLDAAHQSGNAAYLPPGEPVCDDWFAPSERFWVPMRLTVSSALPARFQAKGEAPDDTVTIGLADPADQWMTTAAGQPATIRLDGTYYAGSDHGFAPSDQPPPDASALATASVDVTLPSSGRDPVTVAVAAPFTVATSQYGVWVWRLDLNRQSEAVAPVIAASASDRFGQPAETHLTQMEVVIASAAADTTLAEPEAGSASICDSVWLELASPTDLWLKQPDSDRPIEVVVTGHLYHAAVPGAQNPDPGDVPAVADYRLTFTGAGRNQAQTVCHDVGHGDYGAFGFQYSIDPISQPTASLNAVSLPVVTPLWLPQETTMVRRTPTVQTTATSWTTTSAGTTTTFFQDDIWQSNWPEGPADATAFGAVEHGDWPGLDPWPGDRASLTVELWRIDGAIDAAACSPDNPAARLIATSGAVKAVNSLAGAARVSGSGFRADGPGTYSFVIDWPGDARTQPYRSACGEASETIVIAESPPAPVTAHPTITTQAPPDATTGQAIRDRATLTGPFAAGTVIEFWGRPSPYVDASQPSDQLDCVRPDPGDMTDAVRLGQIILDHPIAAGQTETVLSPEFTSEVVGCTSIKEIAWTPAAPGQDQQVIVQGRFGQAEETTHWHPPSPIRAETGGTAAGGVGQAAPQRLADRPRIWVNAALAWSNRMSSALIGLTTWAIATCSVAL